LRDTLFVVDAGAGVDKVEETSHRVLPLVRRAHLIGATKVA
jgi:hypothetical protein